MKARGIAKWACVNHIDSKYQQWKIDLIVSKEEAAKIRESGIKVKRVVDDDDNITLEVRFTRYLINKKTKAENPKPQCVDAATNLYAGEIGNGSEVIVRYKPYTWTFQGSTGISGDLQGVQILKLVEYERTAQVEDEDDGDFEPVGEGLEGGEDNFKAEKPAPSKKKATKKQEEEPEY